MHIFLSYFHMHIVANKIFLGRRTDNTIFLIANKVKEKENEKKKTNEKKISVNMNNTPHRDCVLRMYITVIIHSMRDQRSYLTREIK